ncbi:MAG: hypothetical protein R3B47_09625 [Bacteroidia bacterium]
MLKAFEGDLVEKMEKDKKDKSFISFHKKQGKGPATKSEEDQIAEKNQSALKNGST